METLPHEEKQPFCLGFFPLSRKLIEWKRNMWMCHNRFRRNNFPLSRKLIEWKHKQLIYNQNNKITKKYLLYLKGILKQPKKNQN